VINCNRQAKNSGVLKKLCRTDIIFQEQQQEGRKGKTKRRAPPLQE
jgi:hypothetical protein